VGVVNLYGKHKDLRARNNIFLGLADLEDREHQNRYDAQELRKSPRESHNFTDVPLFLLFQSPASRHLHYHNHNQL
jgi:hypothetical protein